MAVVTGTAASETFGPGAPMTAGDDTLFAGGGNDVINWSGGSDTLFGEDGNDSFNFYQRNGDNFIYGDNGDDTIISGYGHDHIYGGADNDTIDFSFGDYADGGDGIDTASFGTAVSVNIDLSTEYIGLQGFPEQAATFTSFENVFGSTYEDTIAGDAGANRLDGSGGNDVIVGNGGADVLIGGDGFDKVSYYNSAQGVTVNISGTGQGGDAQGDTLSGFEALEGSGQADSLGGDAGDNQLYGLGGADTLKGLGGADRLEGGVGFDTLQGGPGSDLYIYDSEDIFDETTLGADGYDTVQASVSVDMSNTTRFKGDIEALVLLGADNINGIGSDSDNVITGNAGINILNGGGGADTLDGGLGADTLRGGAGNDTYLIDSILDRINESIAGSDGIDTVLAGFTFSLANTNVISGSVENLTLTGSADINGDGNGLANTITGNAGINVLTGGAGNDVVTGGGGADTFRGGAGDDTYSIDSDDIVDESVAGSNGIDTIQIAATFDLMAPSTTVLGVIENLTLLGIGDFDGKGSALNNTMTGNAGVNTLDGRGGNDILDGGAGNDVMIGGAGNDTFYLSAAEDTIVEAAGGGTDIAYSSVTYVLAPGVSIETLAAANAASTAALNLTGNELGQIIRGNAGTNNLHGGGGSDTLYATQGGSDTLYGDAGDDTFYVDSNGDRVRENTGEGYDRVLASATFSLFPSAEIELLTTTLTAGTNAINLTGNSFAQTIGGNNGANVIDGAGGADTMQGFGGNDSYYVDNALDKVIEVAGGGDDRIYAGVNYTLGAGVAVEHLSTLIVSSTTAINLMGNELVNELIGNNGANVLDGKAGADTMYGNAGDDTYYVDSAGDRIFEANGGGSDRVLTSISYTLAAGQEIELFTTTLTAGTGALNLTGNEFAQTIGGNAGSNIIDGHGGADLMQGFGGNDQYFVDNIGDRVIEAANGGSDRVLSSVSYVLTAGAQVETLTTTLTTGTGAINLTGNEFAQVIGGNNGANYLDGKAGNDTLQGFGGHDSFAFTSALGPANIDTIADFSVPDDTILLAHAIFTGLGASHMLDAAAFVIGYGTINAGQHIIYNPNTGNLYFDDDGNGADVPQQFAHLSAGLTTMTNADFYVA